MAGTIYRETFEDGPGGWLRVVDNVQPMAPLQIKEGLAMCYSPWWVDYNHAPHGGAGYLQLLMCLHTKGPFTEQIHDVGGPNRFVEGRYPLDFTNARISVRLRGELQLRGAQVVLLIQGMAQEKITGWVLTGQPIKVGEDFSEQTITAVPDTDQWTCLGARHDRGDMYGRVALETILRKVNCNIYFVLFPVNAVPMGPIDGDPHVLRAGRDYPLWQSELPEGYVFFDTVEIKFP